MLHGCRHSLAEKEKDFSGFCAIWLIQFTCGYLLLFITKTSIEIRATFYIDHPSPAHKKSSEQTEIENI